MIPGKTAGPARKHEIFDDDLQLEGKCGGTDISQAKRLRALGQENAKLVSFWPSSRIEHLIFASDAIHCRPANTSAMNLRSIQFAINSANGNFFAQDPKQATH
ncbi:hypothetical protein [Bradyrhizobium sp. USDA 4506]